MLFNSTAFAMFLPAAIAGFWFLPFALRRWWLLGMSYLFYMGVFPKYALLLFLVTVINYLSALGIQRWASRRVLLVWISVVLNLAILAYFKYANFLLESCVDVVRMFRGHARFDSLSILMPIGISFYIFIGMSYTIDCFRGIFKPVKNFSLFACYLSFFPQLLAGPIVRARQLLPQLETAAPFRPALFEEGLRLLMLGLFKKVLLADKLAPLVNRGFADIHTLTAPDAWIAILGFTFQIYFDFSGYTDCARGCAKLFGYHLPENFRLPYLARNPREFWRRWHITLSTWLRDYLYISLGGNRCSKRRMYANLMTTMALGGLWHGAGWTFFLWGLYHGLLLVIHRLIMDLSAALPSLKRSLESRWGGILAAGSTFILIAWGWVLFRASSLGDALSMYAAMFRFGTAGPVTTMCFHSTVLIFAMCLLLYHCARASLKRFQQLYPIVQRSWTYGALGCVLLSVIYFSNFYVRGRVEAPEPFIYFQF